MRVCCCGDGDVTIVITNGSKFRLLDVVSILKRKTSEDFNELSMFVFLNYIYY